MDKSESMESIIPINPDEESGEEEFLIKTLEYLGFSTVEELREFLTKIEIKSEVVKDNLSKDGEVLTTKEYVDEIMSWGHYWVDFETFYINGKPIDKDKIDKLLELLKLSKEAVFDLISYKTFKDKNETDNTYRHKFNNFHRYFDNWPDTREFKDYSEPMIKLRRDHPVLYDRILETNKGIYEFAGEYNAVYNEDNAKEWEEKDLVLARRKVYLLNRKFDEYMLKAYIILRNTGVGANIAH